MTRCQAASISVTEFGVDSGVEFTATVEPGTPCRARYVHHHYSANGGGSTGPKRTAQCTVSATASTVSFGCDELSDDIPTS